MYVFKHLDHDVISRLYLIAQKVVTIIMSLREMVEVTQENTQCECKIMQMSLRVLNSVHIPYRQRQSRKSTKMSLTSRALSRAHGII